MAEPAARGAGKKRSGLPAARATRDIDQEPPAEKMAARRANWSRATQACVFGIFIILFFVALEEARTILIPVIAAFVIGTMLGPVAKRASNSRIPWVVTAIGLWVFVVATFYVVIALLSGPVLDLISHAPDIGRAIEDKFQQLERPLAAWPSLRNALVPGNSGLDIANLVKSTAAIVTPAVGQLVIFFATLFFFLLGRPQLRADVIARFKNRDSRLRAIRVMNDIEHHLTGYLGIITIINILMGIAGASIAFFVGLPNPLAWGALAFILNYIPYVGALMMELALLGFGIVTFASLSHALLAPLLYLGVAILEGQFLTPAVLGRRLPLNSLTVFLSVVFWTWLWGPAGTFLATPLVIAAFAIVENIFDGEEPELPG